MENVTPQSIEETSTHSNGHDDRPQKHGDSRQLTVPGRLISNSVGGEMIVFSVNLGLFRLTCLVNIPDADKDEAPVYVKFGLQNPKPHHSAVRHEHTEE